MEDKRKDMIEDNEIDHLLQQLYGFSDEQLLRDFKEMEADNTPRPELEPFPDEFDRIWEDIQAERAARLAEEGKEVQPKEAATVTQTPRRRKLKWKRLAAVGLAACFLTLGFCFVAVGKKSYFYRIRKGDESRIVLNNDSNLIFENSEEEAYTKIKEELGIKPLKLGYMPEGMKFVQVSIDSGNAIMEFIYNNHALFLVQTKDITEVSNCYISDGKPDGIIENRWIKKKLQVKAEVISDTEVKYEVYFVDEGAYYSFLGIMEKDEFVKTAEHLVY